MATTFAFGCSSIPLSTEDPRLPVPNLAVLMRSPDVCANAVSQPLLKR